MTEPCTPPRSAYHRRARIILSLGLLALGVWLIHGFIAALVWAAVLAIAFWPFYERCERQWPQLRRGAVLPALFTLGIGALVLIPVGLGLFRAIAEVKDLMAWFDTARTSGIPVPAWVHSLPFGASQVTGWWQQHLATPEATQAEIAHYNRQLLHHTQNIGKLVLHGSIIFLFTLLALFFTLRDRESLVAQLRSASGRLFGPSGERIGRQVVQSVRGTIDGLVLVGLGEGAIMTVAYVLLGVPHPILLGMATAIAAMIPFGASAMFAIAGFALLTQDALPQAIAVVAIGLAVVGIADHFIRPALIGGATRLPFLWVLIGILGGVETLGLLGLFVGPATMAVLVMLWREYVEHDLPVDAA